MRKPVGPYQEPAMALTFENEGVVYDPEEELLHFFAAEGVLLVRCGISKAALAALQDEALTDPDTIVTAHVEYPDRRLRLTRAHRAGSAASRLEDAEATLGQGEKAEPSGTRRLQMARLLSSISLR
jgi:hypothetical protein